MHVGRRSCVLLYAILITCFWCRDALASAPHFCLDGAPHEFRSNVLSLNTETEEGQVENICLICGYTYMEYLPATGHDYGEWQIVEENTASGNRIKRRICQKCDRAEVQTVKMEPLSEQAKGDSEGESNWNANGLDYVLSVSLGGLWGYVILVLWYNQLVLGWYKRACPKNRKGR